MKQAFTSAFLAAGLVVGALTVQDQGNRPWPPRARDMVTVAWPVTLGNPPLVVVYTVPPGRWFVVEDFEGPSSSFELLNVTTGQVVLGAFQQAEWQYEAPVRDVGLAFAPGTVIAFRNVGGAAAFPPGWLVGYLE